jgi:hypothetical protein
MKIMGLRGRGMHSMNTDASSKRLLLRLFLSYSFVFLIVEGYIIYYFPLLYRSASLEWIVLSLVISFIFLFGLKWEILSEFGIQNTAAKIRWISKHEPDVYFVSLILSSIPGFVLFGFYGGLFLYFLAGFQGLLIYILFLVILSAHRLSALSLTKSENRAG